MKRLKGIVGLALASALITTACNKSSTSSTSTTETCSSGTNVTEGPFFTGGPTCVTNIASDAPDWIKDNFHCVTVQVCSTTYKFKTSNLPPYKTAYYGASSAYYQSFTTTGGRTQNPNTIATQSLTLTIPKTPVYKSSSLDSTAGIDAVGITTYGVVIFNNQAAPGDSFATEYLTMDEGEGHPQNTGKYHHHTDPYNLTTGTAGQKAFIGVMLDGYPIYGKQAEDGSYPTLDATTNTRACTTTLFPNGTYCYHIANATGANGYIIGTSFRGTKGTSN